MFLSLDYKTTLLGPTGKDHYQYKIIDTDFDDTVVFQVGSSMNDTVIVETYRKRNLPVAPNLILYWQFCHKNYGWTIEMNIDWCCKRNPYFPEYEDEINKYLLLL